VDSWAVERKVGQQADIIIWAPPKCGALNYRAASLGGGGQMMMFSLLPPGAAVWGLVGGAGGGPRTHEAEGRQLRVER